MFPWRVAKGVFGFLDAFSKVYGREPMKPSGGPQGHNLQPDLGALWLHGRMVAIKGDEHVAARHVVTFDVGTDDSVVYSNGYGVFRLVDGGWRPLTSANLVENVCC